MQLELHKVYYGFRLLEKKAIKEMQSVAYLFQHEKCGARLLFLENEDDNKVFSITFRTPPMDSTGLPHILEHSVLCGSRKFPVKEPFVELAKGSLNTFLNAFTFPDKTMYPVASKNDKDFRNLMDVYLDAVFYPNIYKYPEILMQEGWHYELEDQEGEITYKGVVYNEMKGAFSSPESIVFRKIQESLFPDTPYGFESGGDPEFIPDLTQEQFEAFHKQYYHPSNSYIFLYGNMDILDQLNFIDEGYLSHFEQQEVVSNIPIQEAFPTMRELSVEYPITPNEKEENKTFLSLNFAIGRSTDPEVYLAFDILEHLLLETSAAPLKKALIQAELGKDVFGSFDNSIQQPTFSIVVKNTNEAQKETFQQVVFETLERLVREGIDKKLIESSISRKEFALREADTRNYPKGLVYNITLMDSWLYDHDPVLHLQYEETLKKIKQALTTDYFEQLIKTYFLENNHRSLLIVRPRKGLAEEKAAELKKKLADYKASLTDQELEHIIKQTQELKKRQTTPDAPEDVEKLPLLEIQDIHPKAEAIPQELRTSLECKILFHPIFTNKIVYSNLLFDLRTVEKADIPYVGVLTGLLGKLSTTKTHYEDLSNEINIHTGGIGFGTEVYSEAYNDLAYHPKLQIKSKALAEKLPNLMQLLGEIIGETRFDEKKRIKEVLEEMKSRLEMSIFDRGHVVAANRAISYFSPVGKINESLKGLAFYQFIVELLKDFDETYPVLTSTLKRIADAIFKKSNLLVSVTSSDAEYAAFEQSFPILFHALRDGETKLISYDFDYTAENEGLMSSGKVQYVSKAYNYRRLGYTYTGGLFVLRTILSYDYLWNRIRVQGGAYGGFASFDRNGNMFMTSYRDPNLKETLEVYDGVEDYLNGFHANEREMTKYIIGTISRLDTPLTPSMKGEAATANYISGRSQADIQKEREAILNTKASDITAFSRLISDCLKQNYICVLGNEEKIRENEGLFQKLIDLFE